jgi:hypothetical protein
MHQQPTFVLSTTPTKRPRATFAYPVQHTPPSQSTTDLLDQDVRLGKGADLRDVITLEVIQGSSCLLQRWDGLAEGLLSIRLLHCNGGAVLLQLLLLLHGCSLLAFGIRSVLADDLLNNSTSASAPGSSTSASAPNANTSASAPNTAQQQSIYNCRVAARRF